MSKILILTALITWTFASPLYGSLDTSKGTHLDGTKVPRGCATCHNGFNFKTGGGMAICLVCHGDPSRIVQEYKFMPRQFLSKDAGLKNVEAEFKKTFHHPTFDPSANKHRANETLPEIDPRAPRHATCADCHNVHYSNPADKFTGIRGRKNVTASSISSESELCYRCHGDSANLPGRSTNKRLLFAPSNPSFHPVEAEGKNSAVVSLLKPYKDKKVAPGDISRVTCGDCHGSDSASSPQGPHGSNYEYILSDNYSTRDDQPESSQNYALCYRCHSRTSILSNESFKYHSLHINGRGSGGYLGTSCYTCHDSHGSTEYRYLIRFNREVVSANAKGVLKFVEKGVASFRGECYLSCHGVDHDQKKY